MLKITNRVVNKLNGTPKISKVYNVSGTIVMLTGIPKIILSNAVNLKFNKIKYPGTIMYAKIANANENIPLKLVDENIDPINAIMNRIIAVLINGVSSLF